MANETPPDTVKLICGMISADRAWFERVEADLVAAFGPIDIRGAILDFDFTDYYDAETGFPLMRAFLGFERLISPEELPAIKRLTNALENTFAALPEASCPRPINIDPGYVAPAKLVLASMKNFSHRICLEGGVYAEVTLLFNRGWQPLPWTFPDYGSGRYFDFLDAARETLLAAQRNRTGGD